jgi:phage portal protein BeeE
MVSVHDRGVFITMRMGWMRHGRQGSLGAGRAPVNCAALVIDQVRSSRKWCIRSLHGHATLSSSLRSGPEEPQAPLC